MNRIEKVREVVNSIFARKKKNSNFTMFQVLLPLNNI